MIFAFYGGMETTRSRISTFFHIFGSTGKNDSMFFYIHHIYNINMKHVQEQEVIPCNRRIERMDGNFR
jgi:hypothetical protein